MGEFTPNWVYDLDSLTENNVKFMGYHIVTVPNGGKALINSMFKGCSKREKIVMGLKIVGFSYNTIGLCMKLSPATIKRIFKSVKTRICQNDHVRKSTPRRRTH